jgi:hypothetical protein
MIRIVPVLVDGVPQLYDVFVNGQWLGSKRLLKWAEELASRSCTSARNDRSPTSS